MSSEASIKVPGGGSLQDVIVQVRDALITEGDILVGLAKLKARILRDTSQGRDADGAPFAPYNSTRPYYFYPNGAVNKARTPAQAKSAKAAVKRFGAKIGRRVSGHGSALTRSGFGIRFPSYAAFKQTYLGRTNVDLTGARAPHMLQQLSIAVGSAMYGPGQRDPFSIGPTQQTQPAEAGTLGIYGEAAARASGLTSDERPRGMPLRRFMKANEQDTTQFARMLEARIMSRVNRGRGRG